MPPRGAAAKAKAKAAKEEAEAQENAKGDADAKEKVEGDVKEKKDKKDKKEKKEKLEKTDDTEKATEKNEKKEKKDKKEKKEKVEGDDKEKKDKKEKKDTTEAQEDTIKVDAKDAKRKIVFDQKVAPKKEGDPEKEAKRREWEAKFGEEVYSALGKPMFSKLYTYDELQVIERPPGRGGISRRNKVVQHDDEKPANWPADTEVQRGTWVFWLPEGWVQGIRTQEQSGLKLGCYMSPLGKRFWHKKDIEKHIGYALPTVDNGPKKKIYDDVDEEERESSKRTKYVTDPDAIPTWPTDEEPWLPIEWKIAWRQLPSGLHRIYIPPGCDEEGFLYHRSTVVDWLAGNNPKLTPMGTSKPMAEISDRVKEHGLKKKNMQKRPRLDAEAEPMQVSPTDYEASQLAVAPLPRVTAELSAEEALEHFHTALVSVKAPAAKELAKVAQGVHAALVARHFDKGLELVAIFDRTTGSDTEAGRHPYSERLCGVYYERPMHFNDKPFYQKAILAEPQGVACRSHYLQWSAMHGVWKLADALHEQSAGVAMGGETLDGAVWTMLKGDLCKDE